MIPGCGAPYKFLPLSSFFGVEINLKLSAEDLPICTVDADYFRIDNLSLLFISILKMYLFHYMNNIGKLHHLLHHYDMKSL